MNEGLLFFFYLYILAGSFFHLVLANWLSMHVFCFSTSAF
jgi:hypothetical protein